MTFIHCTRKLAAKLPEVPAAALEDAGGLGGWYAHLVRFDRVQCVLFCHDATRYCLYLPAVRARQVAAARARDARARRRTHGRPLRRDLPGSVGLRAILRKPLGDNANA
jgi:hypothetical protein